MPPPRRPAAVLLALLAAASLRAGAWPEVQSDLPPDPGVRWGTLSNGLRYAVRHNAEPKGRVSLRLVVAAGSLEERESERGIAHFIEHMAYRGTREHPNGGMTAELQRLGVGFGPDTAAFTFWDHTLYQLELPDTAEATLLTGLGVFREYAQDISFDPALIDRERDVILNERDTRDTPPARASDANLELLFPGSRQVLRKPIGLAENIRRFDRRELVDFYDAWYRPERMAVVVVGDIDPGAVARQIEAVMGGVAARGPARSDAIALSPAEAGKPNIRVFVDKGLPGAECDMEHPFPDPASPDTHERRVARLRRALAFFILERRSQRFSKSSDGKFMVPVAAVTNPVSGWAVATFGASGSIGNWRAFMADLESEQRRAFEFGFTEAEVSLARANFTGAYEDAVRTSATWHSDWVSTAIANSVVAGAVFSAPAAVREDIAAELNAATPAECLAEFRRAWSTESMHVFVGTNPAFRVSAGEIAEALNASRSTAIARPVESSQVVFGYSSFGPPGALVSSELVSDLDVREAVFANGVRLNFKHTDFDTGSVLVFVRVGTGRLSQPRQKPGLDLLANAIVPLGGLGKHTMEDLQEALAGHQVFVNFSVDSDSLDFTARSPPKDLGLCLQLIAAYLTDTAFRPDALPQARASVSNLYMSLASSPSGPIAVLSGRVLSGGDMRFGTATVSEFNARTIGEVRDWIEPQLKGGPVEMSVVGDTTWEEASAQVAATLGALPRRAERMKQASYENLRPPRRPARDAYLATTDPSLRQVGLARFCPVPDLDGVHMERRCLLLAALLSERMRVRLREELGAAYGFEADFVHFDGFPDFSFFMAATNVATAHSAKANELIRSEIEALRRGRFTDDEFNRVKLPFLRSREEDLRNNGYWGSTVLRDAQQRPERLDAARDRQSDCASIKRSEVEKLASRYFGAKGWFQFVAFPGTGPSNVPVLRPLGAPAGFP